MSLGLIYVIGAILTYMVCYKATSVDDSQCINELGPKTTSVLILFTSIFWFVVIPIMTVLILIEFLTNR